MTTADISKDLFVLAGLVYAVVELSKDLYPGISDGYKRLAAYVAGILISSLVVWVPGNTMRDYILLTVYQGITIGVMAAGGHATVKRLITDPTTEEVKVKADVSVKAAEEVKAAVEQVEPVTPKRVEPLPPVVLKPKGD